MVVDFLRGRMLGTLDTGLNLIHVSDVARGHVLAAQRGRIGEKYILGHRNYSLAEIFAMLARITGLPAPRHRVPYRLVWLVALAMEGVAQLTGGPSRVPPGPRGYPLVGVFPMARRVPLKFFLEAARQYGDLVSVRLGLRRAYLVSHPDHIRHILQDSQHIYCKGPPAARVRPMFGESLTTIDGERWQHRRRLMLPAFHPQRLLALGPVITETTAAMLDRWERFAGRSQPLDVLSEMTDLTRLIIVRAVLGDVTPEEARAVGRTLGRVLERTDERLWS